MGSDITAWVMKDAEHVEFRQAVHTILHAISSDRELLEIMVMKGGILLALAYNSTRFTRDIDFSTEMTLEEFDLDDFTNRLDTALAESVDRLPYGIDCRVQSCEQRPPGNDATFPTFKVKIGYASRLNQRAHRRFMQGKSAQVVHVDYSMNEPRGDPVAFEIEDGQTIRTYSFHDMVAEKYRAVLQQEIRNRMRRQDIYDLHLLLSGSTAITSQAANLKVLQSLYEKTAARNLVIHRESMQNSEIKRRSREEYNQLAFEIEGNLPEFEDAYEYVRSYYEALPWDQFPSSIVSDEEVS